MKKYLSNYYAVIGIVIFTCTIFVQKSYALAPLMCMLDNSCPPPPLLTVYDYMYEAIQIVTNPLIILLFGVISGLFFSFFLKESFKKKVIKYVVWIIITIIISGLALFIHENIIQRYKPPYSFFDVVRVFPIVILYIVFFIIAFSNIFRKLFKRDYLYLILVYVLMFLLLIPLGWVYVFIEDMCMLDNSYDLNFVSFFGYMLLSSGDFIRIIIAIILSLIFYTPLIVIFYKMLMGKNIRLNFLKYQKTRKEKTENQ